MKLCGEFRLFVPPGPTGLYGLRAQILTLLVQLTRFVLSFPGHLDKLPVTQRNYNFSSTNIFSSIQTTTTMVDAGERLQVLLTQEATNYQTCDYLSRMQGTAKAQETVIEPASTADQYSSEPSSPKKRKSLGDLTSIDHADSQHTEQCRRTASTTCASSAGGASVGSSSTSSSQINKHWREKICEWAYQGTSILCNRR